MNHVTLFESMKQSQDSSDLIKEAEKNDAMSAHNPPLKLQTEIIKPSAYMTTADGPTPPKAHQLNRF